MSTASVHPAPRLTGDPGLSRSIKHLRALGFVVVPAGWAGPGRWSVYTPGAKHRAALDQAALKSLARACRHFAP